jgi:hypothetical protein
MLEPTPERVAAAKRASGRDWTFGAEGAVEVDHNGVLRVMVAAGLIVPHFVTPTAQINGQDDYYRLTEAGIDWLARAEQESPR